MKFATVLSLGLVGTAFAFPSTPVKREASLVQRDYPTISSAIADIQSKTSALDTQVKNYQTTANSAAVQSASDNVLASINNGNSKIAAGTSVTLAEAYQIGNQVDGLTKVVNGTVDDAIAKKATFVKNKDGGKVYKAFNDQKAAATKLGATIKSKVPDSAKNLADQKTKAIVDALNRGVSAFQDQANA